MNRFSFASKMQGGVYIMRIVFVLLILFVGFPFAYAEEVATSVSESASVPEMELPPAIQELMQKEMEKLPPVERHFRMAQDYSARGKMEEALQEIDLALKEDPKNVPCNCELGIIYMGQGNYDKAIEQLNQTLNLDPQYPKTHYALANAYARKANPDVQLARKHLDEAVKLGYHPVPWFLDYMKKLETQTVKPQENIVSETPIQ